MIEVYEVKDGETSITMRKAKGSTSRQGYSKDQTVLVGGESTAGFEAVQPWRAPGTPLPRKEPST
jgi:hypothetical protein